MTAPHPLPQDEDIVRLLDAQDPDALRLLLQRYSGELTRMLLKAAGVVLFDHEIEEIINTAAHSVWQTYRAEKGPLRSWLFRMTDNARVDLIRRESRHWRRQVPLARLSAEGEELSQSFDPLAKMEFMEMIGRAMESMTPTEREVFLHDWQAGGKANAQEVAQELSTSKDTVYQMRHRYKERLRKCFQGEQSSVRDATQ